jgi:hypothetical protein
MITMRKVLEMTNNKERKSIKSAQIRMTPIEAVYILALGAARADGVVDEAETLGLQSIAAIQGHEKYLEYALSYYEALKDSDNAINGALAVITEAGESYKMAAVVFMKYILEKSGESEDESAFFSKALTKLS